MEVDETMITGHLDHARFSGERCGRILNHLSCSHSVFRTGGSTRSLGEDAAGPIAKLHFARACRMRSPKRSSPYSRLSCPSSRRKRSRVSPCRKSLGFWVAKWSRFAPLFSKKGLLWGAPGLESGKIEKDNMSITYALPFSRTIPVRTPQSASRAEVSRPLCHGRAPLTAGRTGRGVTAPPTGTTREGDRAALRDLRALVLD